MNKKEDDKSWLIEDKGIEYLVEIINNTVEVRDAGWWNWADTSPEKSLLKMIFKERPLVCSFPATSKFKQLIKDANHYFDLNEETVNPKHDAAITNIVIKELRKKGID